MSCTGFVLPLSIENLEKRKKGKKLVVAHKVLE
jgi:hypothetical protein